MKIKLYFLEKYHFFSPFKCETVLWLMRKASKAFGMIGIKYLMF